MQANTIDTYDASIEQAGDGYVVDNHCTAWESLYQVIVVEYFSEHPQEVKN